MYGIFTYICHKNQWNVGKLDGTGVDVHIRRRFPTQGRFHPPTKGTGRHRSDGMTWILRSRTKSFGVDAEIRVIGRVLAHKLPVLLSTHYQYILKRCITVYHYRIHMMILWNIYIYIQTYVCIYTHNIYSYNYSTRNFPTQISVFQRVQIILLLLVASLSLSPRIWTKRQRRGTFWDPFGSDLFRLQ